MFKVENNVLLCDNRIALRRDLIIPESILRELEYKKIEHAYTEFVVINNTLIYVVKYDDDYIEPLAGKWHFAQQKLNTERQVYLYECDNLYIGP